MTMVDGPTVHKTLSCAIQSTRIGIRCLASPRDSQEASQRAVLLLVDILDLLYRIRDQAPDTWVTGQECFLHKQEAHFKGLRETLKWYVSTLKIIERYFQPGGVCVCYFRKNLLEKTFLPQLEQYKIAFLLWMQPESCEQSYIDHEIRDHLKRSQELEPANSQLNVEFEEDALGLTSRLASEHFITLADLCNRRQQGSCKWIFEDSEYKQWLLGGFKTLYCVGPAGAGKTFLSSVIIDSLQRTFTSPDVATIFIFCQEEKENDQKSIDLLQNILAQLVYRKRSLSYTTSVLYYSESLTGDRASTKAYHNAIRAEVNQYSKVFFVVDGLDIFSDKDRILSRLQKLPAHCQLLVTLREAPVAENSSYVDVRTSADDIRCYILSHFHSDANFQNILQDDGSFNCELICEVVHILIEKSRGVFLLAKIHMELLSKYTDRSLLERALHHLPQSLNEAYGEAMKQIISTNPHANRYIYWTLYALRPLSVAELKNATKTVEPDGRQEEMTFEQHLQIQTAGFLTIDAVTGTVRFIHKTVKEYLEGAATRVFFPDAQKDIAEACLTAIASDKVIDDCYVSNKTPRNTSKGFLSYAAAYWGYHAREVPEEEQTIQVLIKTFLNKLQWRRPPQACAETKEMPTELGLGKYPEDWSALHVLAFFGIRSKSKRLLEQGVKANTNDNSLKATPLHCAAARGNDEMIEFLLNSGVDSNATASDGSTALHMATQHGHRKVMKLLLSQPANAQISNHKGSKSLHLAVETATCEATVPLLVKHRVSVNSGNLRTGDTALHLAVDWKRPWVILFLLEKGAVMDMTNEDGLTPLQLAVKTDNCEAISILLQKGAHVDARSFSGLTALQIAAQKKHWVAFDLLVIGGANLDAWNQNGETLLHEQARKSFSSISIATKLLSQGANIEARSPQGYTALQYAAISGNKVMFNYLLFQGAKIDVLTPKGESLLHIVLPLNKDCLDILGVLLDHNLKTTTISSEGWMPLHKIVCMGTGAMDLESDKTREYIELLLSHGADINAYTATAIAETPLHLATRASVCRPQLIPFLIGLGADVNALTNEGKTPLHMAGERGRESIFRILLGAGANFYLAIPNSTNPVPEIQKTTPIEESAISAGSTAFDLARKNPFSVLWLDDEGKLYPAPERKRRDSVGTVIEEDMEPDMEPEGLDDDMTESTLVGSERQLVLV